MLFVLSHNIGNPIADLGQIIRGDKRESQFI
jgi:hypothetical protein